MLNLAFADSYCAERANELRREADRERLAALVAGPGRPIRVRLAAWLVAAAAWIEGSQRAPTGVAAASR